MIEQVSLYPPQLSETEIQPRVVDILPRSLRVLEFGMVYRPFRRDIERLFFEAPWRLSNLEAITVSIIGHDSCDLFKKRK